VTPKTSVDPRTGLEAARLALYVHFPYCLSKCPYCDFASTAAKVVPEVRYTEAILREVRARAASAAGRTVESIFFGGGTPSLWAPARVAEVLGCVRAELTVSPTAEVTLEANPGASDATRFAGYREAGVNRLSIGVQSFRPRTLAALGRAHDGPTAQAAFASARTAGFTNLSMDFIYGVHGQTLAEVESDASAAAQMGPEHLSAYALTLDKASLAEEVPLAKQLAAGEVTLPPDDEVVAMQRAVQQAFAAAGLQRYEVSNYAKPGYHSRHNATYWTGGDYLAVGSGATGCVGATRYANLRSAEKYLAAVEGGQLPHASVEALDAAALFRERVAMGLRLVAGVDVEAVCADFGQAFEPRALALRQLTTGGLVQFDGRRASLTPRGFDVHSAIAAALL
jgi:putative oxygen-independent coproporphyrinogen III oxidase